MYRLNINEEGFEEFEEEEFEAREEAQEYMSNEVLSARLREITNALLSHKDKTSKEILGDVDSWKVRSCMTLFDTVCPDDIFRDVLNQFYGGKSCQRTLGKLKK